MVSLFVMYTSVAYAQVDVLTQHNDLGRTGWNNQETILNTTNVKAGTFGKIFTTNVDDKIYAQPLIVNGVSTALGVKNVVYVATVNNSIYAFDADNGAPIWQQNYTNSGFRPPASGDIHANLCGTYNDFSGGKFGIVGTPVIDKNSNTLYVVTRDVNPALVDNTPHTETTYPSTGFFMRLHAIDIRDGHDIIPPVEIIAKTSGTAPDAIDEGGGNKFVHLDPRRNNQRGGLLLSRGIVYITFAAHCDWNFYHGWVLGYDATTLQQRIVYCSTPNSSQGGIWMSGGAPAVDASGNIYVTTGNGGGNNPSILTDRGESVIKLTPNAPDNTATALTITDFFTPKDYQTLNSGDLDLPIQVLIPPGASSNLAVTGCKDGNLYVMNTVNPPGLGGFSTTSDNLMQKISIGSNAQMHASFAYFGGNTNKYFYIFSEKTALKAFRVLRNAAGTNDSLSTAPISSITGPTGACGAYMSVSSNGGDPASGILWINHAVSTCNANQSFCPGILRAVNASDITQELWNSAINPLDAVDTFAKTDCPTIANGKVYIGSNGKQSKLMVYGLAASNPCPGLLNVALKANNPGAVYSAVVNFVPDNINAGKAFDGTTTTGWHSAFDEEGVGKAYLQIDLGKKYDICSIVIYFDNSNTLNYTIEGSNDNTNFTLLEQVTNNAVPSHTLLLQGQSYRYIRFKPKNKADFQVDHIVNEMEIYGEATNPCAKPVGVSWSNIDETDGTLSWGAVSGALSYNIQYQVTTGITDWRTSTSPTNSVSLHILTCGHTDYNYILQTVCASGTSNNAIGTFTTSSCTSYSCGTLTRFSHADFGDNNIGVAGHYCYFNTVSQPKEFQVHGSGTGIDGSTDAFQYVFAGLLGDEEISAQVKPFGVGDPASSKAGLMMRDILSFNSRFAFIGFTNTSQVVFEYRSVAGAPTTIVNLSGFTMPYYVKLRKLGTQYSAYISPTGANNTWTQVGTTVDLGFGASTINVGPATTSGNITQLATGTLSNFVESSGTPLPITLLGFLASNIDNEYISLQWSTSMETNNDHFEIERSGDDVHFETITSIKAVGNSDIIQNYSAKDQTPLNGINFYRLKQVDLDGRSSYSHIVPVRFGKQVDPLIFPNPATSYFTVAAGIEPIKEVELYNVAGIRLQVVRNEAGNSSLKISSANLPTGIYIVQIRTASSIYKQKLLKQ